MSDLADLFNPTEEHQLLRQTLREFVAKEVEPQARQFDREEKFNLPLFRQLGELGLLGLTVPEADGGSGMDAVAAVLVHEELSYSDPGLCLAYLAHSMLCVNNFHINSKKKKKKRLLPKLISGEWVGAMAMTEPYVGTDVMGMKSTAIKTGDQYILNGRKMWITNGCLDDHNTPCDVVLVYAKTGEKNSKPSLSTFMVEKSSPGFSVGQKIKDKTGMRASNTAELVFTDCQVPASNLLGKEGESILHMMRNLELERLTLAAMSCGIAKRALVIMNQYASDREAFGKPIGEFGQIQKYISESYAHYQACRTYLYHTAHKMIPSHAEGKGGGGGRIDSDGVKLVATTMGKTVADNAIQVLGGYGYVSEYVVERLWRDAKLLEIGGGTLEAHQKNITRDLSKNPNHLLI